MSSAPAPSSGKVDLSGPLTIRQAAVVRDAIRSAFDTQGTVLLSIAEDAEVDLSFLQLVHAARLQAAAEGRMIALDRPAGGNLLSTLERAGFLTDADPRDCEFWLHRKEQP